MPAGTLRIDLDAVLSNWQGLDALSAPHVETGAVVKADAYGLGAARVAEFLAAHDVTTFFVAVASEGAILRAATGPKPDIFVFSGHMAGDSDLLAAHDLIPLLNAPEQFTRHVETLPSRPFGLQLDTGMNRLGMEPDAFASIKGRALDMTPRLIMSHLACADDPGHPSNKAQLRAFHQMTDGTGLRRSLAATAGILLDPAYHFDLCRPGIGIYGGWPYLDAAPVLRLSAPVIQVRDLEAGETIGYGDAYKAHRKSRIATLSAGYADGFLRAGGAGHLFAYANGIACPLVGRVSMDLITVDVTDLDQVPETMDLICENQTIDQIAAGAGTIGHEILTSLGARYERVYNGTGL